MKKIILLLSSSTLLLFAACTKTDDTDDSGSRTQTTNDPHPEDETSVKSSLDMDGKSIHYTTSSQVSISSQSLRIGDGGTMSPATETTLIVSSPSEEFTRGKIIGAEEFTSHLWELRLYVVSPDGLYLASAYTEAGQGRIIVEDYQEYTDSDGKTKTGLITLLFENVKLKDNPAVKTINGEITVKHFVY